MSHLFLGPRPAPPTTNSDAVRPAWIHLRRGGAMIEHAVVHIGAAKCGSSSIRRLLLDEAAAVAAAGWRVGMAWPECAALLEASGGAVGPHADPRMNGDERLGGATAAEVASRMEGWRRAVLTSEAFLTARDPGRLLGLLNGGKRLSEADVLWCLRRADELAERGVCELVRRPGVLLDEAEIMASDYLSDGLSAPRARWLDCADEVRLHLVPIQGRQGDSVAPLIRLLGLDLPAARTSLRENPTLPADLVAWAYRKKEEFEEPDAGRPWWPEWLSEAADALSGIPVRPGRATSEAFRRGVLRRAAEDSESFSRTHPEIGGLLDPPDVLEPEAGRERWGLFEKAWKSAGDTLRESRAAGRERRGRAA